MTLIKRGRLKLIPKLYLYIQLALIAYGAVSNTLVFASKTPEIIQGLSRINLGITLGWAILNLFLFTFFNIKRFEPEAKIYSGYNFLINIFNFTNFYMRFITNYRLLFVLSVSVKVIELTACIVLLSRKEMRKKGKLLW
jgi:hypothetical protein